MLRFYATAIFLTFSGVAALASPVGTAAPGPIAGVGLPALGVYLGYRWYRKRRQQRS